jgi:hypothetical protein
MRLRIYLLVVFFITGCGIPQQQKLADCTTNSFEFTMPVQFGPPYQFVLGMPHSQTGQISFAGEMLVRQGTDTVVRIPISSLDVTRCNWLEHGYGLAGHILTWSRTNQTERLSDLLVRGQTYDVHVTFTVPPPSQSSLWLSSMSKAGL